MRKNNRSAIAVMLSFLTILGADVLAQEFRLGDGRLVSLKHENHGANTSDDQYSSELVLKTGAETRQIIDRIYFHSSSACVKDIFDLDLDFDGTAEIVLISADEIPSDPIEGNVGSYIDVKVYKSKENRFERSERLSDIFSGGVDKAVDPAADKVLYKFIYPYKTKKDIEQFVATQLYKEYVGNNSADYVMQQKTTIYKEPYLFDSKMYLIENDKIKVTDISGGWATFFYLNSKGGKIQASVKLVDLKL